MSTISASYNTNVSAADINQFKNAINGVSAQSLSNGWTDSRGTATHSKYDYDNSTGKGNTFSGADDSGGDSGPAVTWTYGTTYFTSATTFSLTYGNVTAGAIVYATDVNNLLTDLLNAGAVCVCNCNYCTCNCNYCVCNCNYACTCNCNYSDQRLKENIKLIETESNLNVYSYTYIWNRAKTYIGVMAQELIGTKYESALGKDSNGYYYVDYSQLPVTFREA